MHVQVLLTALVVMLMSTEAAFARQREIPAAAAAIADELASNPASAIAVVDFTDLQGTVTELGRFVAEEIALGLVTSKKGLSVVDRTHLKALLQENKLAASGIIDPATARRLGQIAGVENLVTGTITPLSDSVRVVVKVLDTETARVVTAASIEIVKNKTIEELLARDIRGQERATASSPAGESRASTESDAAVRGFQNDRLRVSAQQLAVSANNWTATLALRIENVTREPLRLGIAGDSIARAAVGLSDDQGTNWGTPFDVKGIEVIRVERSNDLSKVRESDLTTLGPSEQVNVIMSFQRRQGGTKPGSSFSVAVNGLYAQGHGIERVSIGVSAIKPRIGSQ